MRGAIIAAFIIVPGCAQYSAYTGYAVEAKRAANDEQARAVDLATCDLSLGGLDQLDDNFACVLIKKCTGFSCYPPAVAPQIQQSAPLVNRSIQEFKDWQELTKGVER